MTDFEVESFDAAWKALGRELLPAERELLEIAIKMHLAAAQLSYPVARAILSIFD